MLVAGAAGAGALVLKGLPVGAEPLHRRPELHRPPPRHQPVHHHQPVDHHDHHPPPGARPRLPGGHPRGQALTKDFGFDPPYPASYRDVRPMMFPLLGTVSWSDTYLAPRGGGRRHEGQDLMAAR